MMRVFYTAAHYGFPGEVPLGGGAAVCRHLLEEWGRTQPFDVQVLSPDILGSDAPRHHDLVRFDERRYADFCVRFERALTERLLREDPEHTVILANDVCEGPDFARLAARGFSIFTIYHVDVIDYVSRMYLRGFLAPHVLTKAYAAVDGPISRRLLPSIVRLLLPKQQDSVLLSRGLIVPSQGMKDVMRLCYPSAAPEKIHVLPWGIWEEPAPTADVAREKRALEEIIGPDDRPVLLMLSRISPEKRQDRLLKALALWESQTDFPDSGLTVLIAGEAAYMHGIRFERELRRLASKLRRTRVIFTGYAAGARKAALFDLADLYVFPSEHESYGLTLLEAMRHGVPALACASHGTRDLLSDDVGLLVGGKSSRAVTAQLLQGLKRMLSNTSALQAMGRAAAQKACQLRFSDAAARLAELIARR